MRYLAKFTVILSLFLSAFSQANNVTSSGAWKIAVDREFMPFSYVDESGKLTGLYVDIIEKAMSNANIQYELTGYPWKRVVSLTDKNDVVFSIPWRGKPERFEKYHMMGPLSASKSVFFSRSGANISYNTMDDLAGKSVGMIDGFAYPKEFDQATNLKKMKVPGSGSQMLKMLIKGRFDLIIGDITVVSADAKKMGILGDIRVVAGPDLFGAVERFAAFNKANEAEAQKFAAALTALQGTPELKEIFSKYGLSE